jgi:hypothetical protein
MLLERIYGPFVPDGYIVLCTGLRRDRGYVLDKSRFVAFARRGSCNALLRGSVRTDEAALAKSVNVRQIAFGTHQAATQFLRRALASEQTEEGTETNANRAMRLMRLFIEQLEAMTKLKGKGGQQRVVVEHVTVAAGGQAIVGAVIPGGRGTTSGD